MTTKKSAPRFRFRLFVAGESPNSTQAVSNLRALCEAYIAECHEIEIVDVTRNPERAVKDNVLLTPTLVKLSPGPSAKVIGNLSNSATVLEAIGLPFGTK